MFRLSDALDGGDLVCGMHRGKRKARIHALAIHMHGAGSALAVIAALLRARKVQVFPQAVQQRGPRIDSKHAIFAVHSRVTDTVPGGRRRPGASAADGASCIAVAARTGEAVAAIPAAPRWDRKERRVMRAGAGCSAISPRGPLLRKLNWGFGLSISGQGNTSIRNLGNGSPIRSVRDPGRPGVYRNRKRITIWVTLARNRSVDIYCTLQCT